MHDGLCQELAGVTLLMRAMQRKLEDNVPVGRPEIDQVAGLAQAALIRAHGLANRLNPVKSPPTGLMVALQRLAAQVGGAPGISCRFRCPRRVEIDEPLVAIHLYRIAEEWIHHAIRRRRATQILVTLARTGKDVTLTLSDNAPRHGASPNSTAARIIHRRARMIGAEIAVKPRRAGGTRMTCHLNIRKGL